MSGGLRGGSTRDRILRFLLARLAEDAAGASRLAVGPVAAGDGQVPPACAPYRLLREVAAKRAIVEIWRAALDAQVGQAARWPHGPCDAVIAAILPLYAEHADFDPSWLSPGCRAPAPEPTPLRPQPRPLGADPVPAPRRRLRLVEP